MAKRMAEVLLAKHKPAKSAAHVEGSEALEWLAELSPAQANAFVLPHMPERISGADFAKEFGAVDDAASNVKAHERYPVAAGLRFVTGEDARVRSVVATLRILSACAANESSGDAASTASGLSTDVVEAALRSVGESVTHAHGDYTALGLGCAETDAIVHALTQELGPDNGVYGARVSGGGSGGTIAVLCREEAVEAIRALSREPRFDFASTGRAPTIIV
jgi:L-arabinokinase